MTGSRFRLVLGCSAALAAGWGMSAKAAETPAAPPPLAEQRFYGNPWAANGLANLEVGRYQGGAIAYRFRADETGEFKRAKVFFIFRIIGPSAYAKGTGGQVRIELRPDDGTPHHFPNMDAAPLSSHLIADPLNKTPGSPIWGIDKSKTGGDPRAGASFPEICFPPATLHKGQLYHLVFTNPDADPSNNYTSLDLLNENRFAKGPIQPCIGDLDFCCLWKPAAGKPWELKNITPILEIHYADGHVQGQGYIDAASAPPILGPHAARTTLTVSGADQRVSEVRFRVSRQRDSGDIVVRLEQGDGTKIEEGRVPAATLATRLPIPWAGKDERSLPDWAAYTFQEPRVLARGQTYHLMLTSPSGSGYTHKVSSYPAWLGFTAGNFQDGYFQYSEDGKTWKLFPPGKGCKQQLYFVLVGGGGHAPPRRSRGESGCGGAIDCPERWPESAAVAMKSRESIIRRVSSRRDGSH